MHDSKNCPYCQDVRRKLVDIWGLIIVVVIIIGTITKYYGIW